MQVVQSDFWKVTALTGWSNSSGPGSEKDSSTAFMLSIAASTMALLQSLSSSNTTTSPMVQVWHQSRENQMCAGKPLFKVLKFYSDRICRFFVCFLILHCRSFSCIAWCLAASESPWVVCLWAVGSVAHRQRFHMFEMPSLPQSLCTRDIHSCTISTVHPDWNRFILYVDKPGNPFLLLELSHSTVS